MNKSSLRTAIQERLLAYPREKRLAESRSVCRRLGPEIPDGSVVCAYSPLTTEVDIRPLIEELQHRDCTIYLPCFEDNALTFRQFESWDTVSKGELNISEPPADAPKLSLEAVDFVLVPGRAYDGTGRRLGRGNGGYDIWIEKLRKKNANAKCIGIALECQMVEEVPVDPHDQPMDGVVTAREVKWMK